MMIFLAKRIPTHLQGKVSFKIYPAQSKKPSTKLLNWKSFYALAMCIKWIYMAKSDKIIGYILLSLGVILLFFSVYEMMDVYIGHTAPPQLIQLSDLSLPIQDANVTLIEGAQLSQLPNLLFWFILNGFILLAGGKIAQVGVNMVKEVKVEVKETFTKSLETKTV